MSLPSMITIQSGETLISPDLLTRRIDSAILQHEVEVGVRETMHGVNPRQFGAEAIKCARDTISRSERIDLLGQAALTA